MDAIDWLVQQVNSDCYTSTFIRKDLIDKAKEMQRAKVFGLLDYIDTSLALIEDYAKGEVGEDITKLRKQISELYKL